VKKIIIIGSAYPYRGGLASYNERLAQAFQSLGYEVKIYTFTLQYPSLLFPGKTQYSSDPSPKDLNIVQAINSVNPLNWVKVGKRIRQEEPDLVICKFWLPFMGPCFGTIGRIIKRNKKTRFITIIDNIIPHEKRPGDKMFAQYFVNVCDAFITMSRAVQNDLKLFTPSEHVRFIHHPIYDNYGAMVGKSEARRWLKIKEDTKLLLFFGFIRRYKGLDLLIEAMNDARIRNMEIKLLVAGEYYGDASYYQSLIAKFGLEDSIIEKAEFISNEEVRYYFGAADLVVQPYRTATQSGISQMAYNFEKPMVVTNVGGLPEIVPHGKAGYVVEPHPQAISDAIVDFYEEEKEVEFALNVAEQKKRFSWEAMAGGVLELYDAVK